MVPFIAVFFVTLIYLTVLLYYTVRGKQVLCSVAPEPTWEESQRVEKNVADGE